MYALFACTKCHGRFVFDDLSDGDQLCKDCRSNYPIVKCMYCRAEFHLSSKSCSEIVCTKCARNLKLYGKPKACQYCSVLAAFIGKQCKRCVNSRKRWGDPVICEQCKLKCAFKVAEDCKGKVGGGKPLCWLCTQAYKRVLAKTLKSRPSLIGVTHKSVIASPSTQSTFVSSLEDRINRLTSQSASSPENKDGLAAAILLMASNNTKPAPVDGLTGGAVLTIAEANGAGKLSAYGRNHRHTRINSGTGIESLTSSAQKTNVVSTIGNGTLSDPVDGCATKRRKHHQPRMSSRHCHGHHHHPLSHRRDHHSKSEQRNEDTSPRTNIGNGLSDSVALDTHNSENVILVTQLREQIKGFKRQLQAKDVQLLEKDRKINELKAAAYEMEKECRIKVQSLQKMHEATVTNWQNKNRDLQRQITKLSKGVKRSILDSISNSG